MLRSCTLLAVLLLLTGCFSVGDFGAYWGQAQIDPALTGRWQKLPDGKSDGKVEQLVFTERDQAHEVNGFVDGKPADDPPKPLYPVKALTLGQHHFLLNTSHSPGGDMMRYTLKDRALVFYSPQRAALVVLPNLPATVKIEEYSIEITRLDDATAQWLASVPADEKFWHRDAVYRQVP